MGNDKKRSGFFSGFLLGSIFGVIIAFLLSQKGGQHSIKTKLGEAIARGRETIQEAIEEGKEAAAQKEAEIQAGLHKDSD